MIDILIKKNSNNIYFLKSCGHASKEQGFSVSCFGVSFLLRNWIRTLTLSNINIDLSVDNGFLECKIKDKNYKKINDNLDNFLIISLKDLKKEFEKDIILSILEI